MKRLQFPWDLSFEEKASSRQAPIPVRELHYHQLEKGNEINGARAKITDTFLNPLSHVANRI